MDLDESRSCWYGATRRDALRYSRAPSPGNVVFYTCLVPPLKADETGSDVLFWTKVGSVGMARQGGYRNATPKPPRLRHFSMFAMLDGKEGLESVHLCLVDMRTVATSQFGLMCCDRGSPSSKRWVCRRAHRAQAVSWPNKLQEHVAEKAGGRPKVVGDAATATRVLGDAATHTSACRHDFARRDRAPTLAAPQHRKTVERAAGSMFAQVCAHGSSKSEPRKFVCMCLFNDVPCRLRRFSWPKPARQSGDVPLKTRARRRG